MFSRVEPGAALDALRSAPAWVYVGVVALMLLNSLIYVLRLTALAAAPLWATLRGVLLGNFVGLVLPTGGAEAVRVVALAPLFGGADRTLGLITASRVLELVTWAGLVAWAAVAVLPGRLPELLPLAGVTVLGFACIVAAVMVGGPRLSRLGARTGFVGRVQGFLTRAAATLAELPRRRLLASWLWTLPFAAVNCGAVWLAAFAHDVALSYPESLGLIPTLDVIIVLPLTIDGVGVRESLFVHGLAPFGATEATALAVALTRWFGQLSRSAAGGVFWLAGRLGP